MANKPVIDDLTRSGEYVQVIKKIVDLISEEDMRIQLKLRELKAMPESLDKFAGIAEYKIKARQIDGLRKKVRQIISRSTNKLVIATILPESN